MEISESLLKFWREAAQKDGLADDYDYHLKMVYPPLPYGRWKLKFERLTRIQADPRYPTGEEMGGLEVVADKLCTELGY